MLSTLTDSTLPTSHIFHPHATPPQCKCHILRRRLLSRHPFPCTFLHLTSAQPTKGTQLVPTSTPSRHSDFHLPMKVTASSLSSNLSVRAPYTTSSRHPIPPYPYPPLTFLPLCSCSALTLPSEAQYTTLPQSSIRTSVPNYLTGTCNHRRDLRSRQGV